MREFSQVVGRLRFGRRAGADLEAEKKTVDLAMAEMIQVRKPAR